MLTALPVKKGRGKWVFFQELLEINSHICSEFIQCGDLWEKVYDSRSQKGDNSHKEQVCHSVWISSQLICLKNSDDHPQDVLVLCHLLIAARHPWSCVQWWWYSPLVLLYTETNPPPPPFRDYSNWSLPLTCNPIERKRLLYLTVETHSYSVHVLFAT